MIKQIGLMALLLLVFMAPGPAQLPQPDQNRYFAPDDARRYDSPRYVAEDTVNPLLPDISKDEWPKINNISFNEKKNFSINAGTAMTITKQTNGIQLSCQTINMADLNSQYDQRYMTLDTNQTANGDKNFMGRVNFRKIPNMNTPGTVTLAVNPPTTIGTGAAVGLQWWGVNNVEKAYLDMIGNFSAQSLLAITDVLANRVISPLYYVTNMESYDSGTMQIAGSDMAPTWWTTYDEDPNVYLAPTGTVQTPNIFLSDTSNQIVFEASGIGSMTLTGDGIDRDVIITFPNNTGTVATLENLQTFSGENTFSSTNTFSATQNYTNATLGIDITNTSPLLKFTDTTATTDDWQIGGSTNDQLTIRNTTDSRDDFSIRNDGNIFLTNRSKKTTITGDTNAIENFNIESTLTVKSKTPFNGTITYLKSALVTCYGDYNSGTLMQVRGIGCV